MKEKSKKIISIAIVLFMVLNYFVPVINYAEDNIKEGTEQQTETEEIGREYEIKETEEWDISENGDKSVIAKWNFADKSITIFGQGNMKNWQSSAKEDWHGKYKTFVEKVVINDGITNIGDYAFKGCSSLKEITIPSGVTSIGSYAFNECNSLKEITIPSGVTSIGSYVFNECSSLKEITISSGVTSIGSYAFKGCSSLKEIIIPSSVISIREYAFYECSSLKEITIPSSVKSIGKSTFSGCSSLEEITIPSSVTSIGDSAFFSCSSLKEIKVSSENKKYTSVDGVLYSKDKAKIIAYPANKSEEKYIILDSATSIECGVFSKCSSLKEITIPNSVTSIGKSAFHGCSSLKEITIPSSVTSIEWGAFNGCSSLEKITIPNTVTSIGEFAFSGCSSLKEIIIPSSVTSIEWGAFYGCSSLEEITIPNSVTSIKDWIFYGCSSLEEITIPNGVTSIGDSAFNGCSSLKEIIIPSSVTSIEMYVFEGCSSLKEITIPSSVTSIEWGAFNGVKYIICKTNSYAHKYAEENEICYKLLDNEISQYSDLYEIKETEEWDISENSDKSVIAKWNLADKLITISGTGNMKNWKSSATEDWHRKYITLVEKVIINNGITNIGNQAFNECSCLEEITLPSSVTSIGYRAFNGCSSLKETTIPKGVTSISDSAFKGCSSLEEIIIPNSVTSIERSAFNGCSSLKEIIIPNSVTSIGDWAFDGCSSLKEITIPSSITSVGDWVFDGCSSLKEIKVSSENKNYTSVDGVLYSKDKTKIIAYPANKFGEKYIILDSATSIESSAFKGCSSLKEIIIPNSVTSIESSAFNGCSSLKEIIIPNSVTSIGDWAFDGCSSLKEITIPSSITSVGHRIFYGCSSLEEIIIPNSVTNIEYDAFYGCSSLKEIIIPSSVTSIGTYVFYGCSSLKEIIIPSSVTSIGKYAFAGVKYITCKTNSYAHKYAEENEVPYILDQKPPEVKVEYSITKLTNQNVISIITSNEKLQEAVGWTLSEDKKTLTKEYTQNTEEEITVKDLAGNEVKQIIKIDNIVKTLYSPGELTNQNVTVTITSNKELQGISGWTLSTDKMTLTKEYTQNTEEEITVKDLAGNEVKQTIKIANIDKVKPELKVNYSPKELTNKNVTATITSNKELQGISGWTLSTDKMTLTKEYTQNKEEEVTVKDLAGNEAKISIKINNIEKNIVENMKGDLNENKKIDIGDILILKRYIAYNSSKEIANKYSEWNLDAEKLLIGDVNKNGKIDIGDILKLQRYIAATKSKEISEKHSGWLNL